MFLHRLTKQFCWFFRPTLQDKLYFTVKGWDSPVKKSMCTALCTEWIHFYDFYFYFTPWAPYRLCSKTSCLRLKYILSQLRTYAVNLPFAACWILNHLENTQLAFFTRSFNNQSLLMHKQRFCWAWTSPRTANQLIPKKTDLHQGASANRVSALFFFFFLLSYPNRHCGTQSWVPRWGLKGLLSQVECCDYWRKAPHDIHLYKTWLEIYFNCNQPDAKKKRKKNKEREKGEEKVSNERRQ